MCAPGSYVLLTMVLCEHFRDSFLDSYLYFMFVF